MVFILDFFVVLYKKGILMTHTHETLLTVQELSQLLKVKPDTIYHWNLRNAFPEIKRVKIAGKLYFKLSSIADLIND